MSKISVIVPIYNIETCYLQKCIESIINQTFKDIEIILILDGALEKEEVLCLKYAQKDDRIKLIKQENKGVSFSRNLGIKEAKGEWVAFVDGDDYLEAKYLEKLYKNVNNDKTNIAICNPVVEYKSKKIKNRYINENDTILNKKQIEEIQLQIIAKGNKKNLPKEIRIGSVWGVLYNKKFLMNNDLYFNTDLKHMEDNIFNLYAFEKVDKISYINDYLYHYIKRENSISNYYSPNIVEYFENFFKELKIFIVKYDKPKIFEDYYNVKVVNSFYTYARLNFFNTQNTESLKNKIFKIKDLINRKLYKKSLKSVKMNLLTLKQKLFVSLIKLRLIYTLYFIMKIFKI